MKTPLLISQSQDDFSVTIKSLITLYSSTYIIEQINPSIDKLTWEFQGLASAKSHKDIFIARICDSFQKHLENNYGAETSRFIDYPSSLLIESTDFEPLNKEQIKKILSDFKIPLNKKIIFAFGRANYVKGFDIFLKSLAKVKEQAHIVLIASGYSATDEIFKEYRNIVQEQNIKNITLITKYSRELPRALSQWYNSIVAVCPSRGDTFPNVPLEIALWAKDAGPICVTSNANGLDEQIINGFNGFKFDIMQPKELETLIYHAFNLNEVERNRIRGSAYKKVINERDFITNFECMLSNFWKKVK